VVAVTGLPEKYADRYTLSVAEAAEATGYSVDTIEKAIAEGRLVVSRLGGERGKRMITVVSLLAAIGVPTDGTADTPEGTEGE
jgi:excisionase family DNA binding protein